MPNFSTIVWPIYTLVKKDQEFYWGHEQQKALEMLKRKMTKASILLHPDFEASFILYTDTFYIGFGYILVQEWKGCEYPIAYSSKRMLPAERNYSVINLERAVLV